MTGFTTRSKFYNQLFDNEIPGITLPGTCDERDHCFHMINMFYDGWSENPDIEDPYKILAKLLNLQEVLTEIKAPLSVQFDIMSQISPPSLRASMYILPSFPKRGKIWGNSNFQLYFIGTMATPSKFLLVNIVEPSKYKGVWTSFWTRPSFTRDYRLHVKVANSKLKVLNLTLQSRKKSLKLKFKSHRYTLEPMEGELPIFPPVDTTIPPKLPTKIEEQLVLSFHPQFADWFRQYYIVPMPKITEILSKEDISFPMKND